MTEIPEVINALLHVADNSEPFVTDTYYSTVTFVSGYPLGTVVYPTVALYKMPGGSNSPKGLGTVQQYRVPAIRVDVFTEHGLENERIVEKLRDVWQADFDVADTDDYGEVGSGYLRETGGIKYITFSEAGQTPWDNLHFRQTFDITVRVSD